MRPKVEHLMQGVRALAGHGVWVPEFTFGDLRIDALIVDTQHRWVRGFEIKTSRSDFQRDSKWTTYSQFCSTLTIVCPAGMLQREDVQSPFGLLWISGYGIGYPAPAWVRRPLNLQRRNSLSWLWTYTRVLERELPRLSGEVRELRQKLGAAQ